MRENSILDIKINTLLNFRIINEVIKMNITEITINPYR